MTVIEEIAAERRRQIEAEGWTPEHDDSHVMGELAMAAACYAAPTMFARADGLPELWPWSREWWKPKDRRRNLVIAAALIAAEIERLDRRNLRDHLDKTAVAVPERIACARTRNPATKEPSDD